MQTIAEVQYTRFVPADWPRVKNDIMRLHNAFFGGTCLLEDEKTNQELFENPSSIAFLAYRGTLDHVVGFSLGLASSYFKEEFGKYYVDDDRSLLYHYDKIGDHDLHLDFIAVDKAMQNQGIGRKLFDLLMKEAASRNYQTMTVHAKSGPSAHMFEKLNPVFKGACPNFFDTGDDYIFYKVRIR